VRRRGGPRGGDPERGNARGRAPRFAAAILLALILSGCSVIDTSTPAAPSTSAPSTTSAPARHHYSEEALSYFSAIALSAEYGDGEGVIRKWTTDVRIAIHGDPTDEDLATLDHVVADLNALMGPIELEVVRSKANADLYFAPESEFASIAPEYVPVNMGFFWTWWDQDGGITRARLLVSTTDITQTERDHIIREEVTQSLGLMNDSYTYKDSVFYQGWTSPTKYSALDESLIEMLYLPEVTPGMAAADALAVLRDA
jgi:hypothetical protein